MEHLNLKILSKNIATAKLKQSLKITIRDVDEESKNYFVAYADDKESSYDVAITLDEKQNVLENNCDCGTVGMCLHKVAFMVYLSNKNEKTKTKTVRAKKITPTEALVNTVEANALRIWLNDFLKKNKDAEFLFVNEFSINTEMYDIPKVKKLIEIAIKTVVNSRKKIETSELAKIVILLESSLKPVIDFCQNEIQTKDGIALLLFVMRELHEFDARMYKSSVKIIRLVEKISKQTTDYILILKDEAVWQKIIAFHFQILLENDVKNSDIHQIKIIYSDSLDTPSRKLYFAKQLKDFFVAIDKKGHRFQAEFSIYLLTVLQENDLFTSVWDVFKDIKYENTYNLLLIDNLLAIDKIDKAKTVIKAQIMGNYYPEYNLEYWKRLKIIYLKTNNKQQLTEVLCKAIVYEPLFEDYCAIKDNLKEDEFKTFRAKFLPNIRRAFGNKPTFPKFYFQVMNFEKNYKKMIESINSYVNYDVVYEYREEMFLADKKAFIKATCEVEERYYYQKNDDLNLEFKAKLLDWIFERYDLPSINTFVKANKRMEGAGFFKNIENRLQKRS